ncbi:hypothetical protein KAS45_03335 [candidate division WOR-3 bacterium]|nr:hypothetical protein [candidate division WOR-3 bacterium]
MKAKIEEIFDKLIAEVRKGRSVDDCLREYAEYADELKPLLHLANTISDLPKPEPGAGAVEATIKQARAISSGQKRSRRFSFREIFVLRPVMVRVFAIVLLILVFGVATVSLSASSLPGDMLYPVKKATERVQLLLTFNTEGKARLHTVFADKRTDEFESLLEPGVEISEELLAEMLHETDLAIACVVRLDEESSADIIDQIDECCHNQMAVLEKARDCVCEMDIGVIEEAMQECMEQHECIECIKDSDYEDKPFCPCSEEHRILS